MNDSMASGKTINKNNDFFSGNEYESNAYRFYNAVSKRLKIAFDNSKLKERELARRCKELGINLNQSTISKILNYSVNKSNKRAPTFSLMHVVYLCKVMELDLSKVLAIENSNLDDKAILPSAIDLEDHINNPSLVFNTEEYIFNGYLGDYYCYFYPTISSEHELLEGKLSFERDDMRKRCNAERDLQIAQQGENKETSGSKKYTGSLTLSIPQSSCYCILSNIKFGEICMLNFHHRYFLTDHGLQCRLACAITTSAGENRRPTIHRVLISKNRLSKDELDVLKSQLLLNSKTITIAQKEIETLIHNGDLPEEISRLFGQSMEIRPEPFYSFDESKILGVNITIEQRIKALCKMREFSTAERYNKVSSKADEQIYKYLKAVGTVH